MEGFCPRCRPPGRPAAEALLEQTRVRAKGVFRHGTTTIEAKTGYGLDTESELRQLDVLLALDREGPLDILPTFIGGRTP